MKKEFCRIVDVSGRPTQLAAFDRLAAVWCTIKNGEPKFTVRCLANEIPEEVVPHLQDAFDAAVDLMRTLREQNVYILKFNSGCLGVIHTSFQSAVAYLEWRELLARNLAQRRWEPPVYATLLAQAMETGTWGTLQEL